MYIIVYSMNILNEIRDVLKISISYFHSKFYKSDDEQHRLARYFRNNFFVYNTRVHLRIDFVVMI